MKSLEDRRALHIPRVPLTTLVDICTQGDNPSPFQAESANVSGRGMQVRTSYLPVVGEELVCRLEHDGREVLVEGRVAWRSEGADSGEFGIQFTALDADSADILQTLGDPPQRKGAFISVGSDEEDADEPEFFLEGSRVKLHIDGLGAPMKACVHEGNLRKLRVGSCLEFLKVGRKLQVEDLARGMQRGAQVDSVNVVINPATSVPELVVQLRYEGVSPTPPPARVGVDYEDEAFKSVPARAQRAVDFQEEEAQEFDDDEAAPWEPAAEAIKARLGGAMASAGQAAKHAGGLLSQVAKSARDSVSAVKLKSGGASPRDASRSSVQPHAVKRRQTSRRSSVAAPAHLRSGIHDLGLRGKVRPSSPPVSRGSKAPAAAMAPVAKRKIPPAALFGGAFLLFLGSAFALRATGASEEKPEAVKAAPAQAPETQSSVPAPAKVAAAPKKEEPEEGVVAEVPLFGPQAMAVKPAETQQETVDVAEAEKRAAAAAVEDETWDEAPSETSVEKAKPWGRGRLYLPTIHRIRLDGVGESLAGAINPDGFTVVIPGRKAMESGKSIQKRDRRIVAVESSNGARGATVKFEFRGSVPPYRVRLRKDFVEFLISAPEESVARL